MNTPLRACRRCLLRELTQEDAFQNVYAYIESLPETCKASDALYVERLAHCRLCDHLMNGMCALCGCFVEVRAVKKGNACPDTPKRWAALL